MIKFFRHIRKRLLAENRFSRYLIYAIGEIILVVIGILIALQINNTNQARKEKEELSKIYESIIEELNTDIAEAEKVVPVFEWKTKVMNRIVRNQVSDEEWVQNDSIIRSFAGATPDFDISKERYALLKQKSDLDDVTRKLNNQIADFYHQFSVDMIASNENFDESFYSDISYWRENTTFFGQYLIENDRAAVREYAKGNPSFRNRVAYKRIVMSRLGSVIKKYRDGAEELVTKIESYLN
jgi:hypothetical protein